MVARIKKIIGLVIGCVEMVTKKLREVRGARPKSALIFAVVFAVLVAGSSLAYVKLHSAELADNLETERRASSKVVHDNSSKPASVALSPEDDPKPSRKQSQPHLETPSAKSSTEPNYSAKVNPQAPPQVSKSSKPEVKRPVFRVSYLSLEQPNVYCSSGGDAYIAQIGDVLIGFDNGIGGKISYGFEVTGGIPDNWNGYRQPATIPSGVQFTSINKLRGYGDGAMLAYSEVIGYGHGPAAIRAVVYSPNVVYSPWMKIPAQAMGEKCK